MTELPKLTMTEMLLRLPIGEPFYTAMKDMQVASYAYRAGVKVRTERMLAIHAPQREMEDVTRVTILERDTERARKVKTITRTAETVRERVRRTRPG